MAIHYGPFLLILAIIFLTYPISQIMNKSKNQNEVLLLVSSRVGVGRLG